MYSLGFRQAAIHLYDHFKSMKKVSQSLCISLSTIWTWLRKGIEFKKRSRTPVSDSVVMFIKETLLSNPSTTHQELHFQVLDTFNVTLSRKCIASILASLRFSKKRIRYRGSVPKGTTEARIRLFRETYSPSPLVFSVDECGFDFRCLPIYGYAPKGTKAILRAKSTSNRTRTSLIMGVSSSGEKAFKLVEGTTNALTFCDFLDLLPCSSTIILDNASFHKTKQVIDKAKNNKITLLFIPPYTPECNPIENVFSVIKARFRKKLTLDCFDNSLHKDILLNILKELDNSLFSKCFRHMKKWLES